MDFHDLSCHNGAFKEEVQQQVSEYGTPELSRV